VNSKAKENGSAQQCLPQLRDPKWGKPTDAEEKSGKGSLPVQSMVSILSIKSIVRRPENRNVASVWEVWEMKNNVLGGCLPRLRERKVESWESGNVLCSMTLQSVGVV
jgi:hypothetical protein